MKVSFVVLTTVITLYAGVVDAFDHLRIKKELLEGRIVPDALDEFDPITDMRITYPDKTIVENGMLLPLELTLEVPRFGFDPRPNTEYTMVMVNLDSHAPQVLHWITTNMNGTGIEDRHHFTPYQGPTPPAGATDHRIVYALFEQKNKNITLSPLSDRVNFDIKKFITENNLNVVNAAYIYTQGQEINREQQVKQDSAVDEIYDDLGNVVDMKFRNNIASSDGTYVLVGNDAKVA